MQFIWGLLFSKMLQNADTLYWEPSLPRLPHKYIEPKKASTLSPPFFLAWVSPVQKKVMGEEEGGVGGVRSCH